MDGNVKQRRAYRSERRRAQAAGTRTAIVTAAGRLFRERGYGVPLPEVAAEAGVAVETVYRIFGMKAGLFRAVVDSLLAGGPTRAEIPVADRPAIRAIHDEPDPARQITLYAATQPGIHRRAGPILRALRDARASDPELDRLWSDLERQRLAGQGRFIALLAVRGALRRGLTVDEATDILWTLCSLAVHDLLVRERGWTSGRYEIWLAGSLIDQLLPDPNSGG
jgi:AcrR family transcriptional regulator